MSGRIALDALLEWTELVDSVCRVLGTTSICKWVCSSVWCCWPRLAASNRVSQRTGAAEYYWEWCDGVSLSPMQLSTSRATMSNAE